ncbi:MAG: pyruvate, phosphate dikinase [Chloroflexi bacterium]|nr:pyruvate, phosphate dikinase [Chloroflexota bacterium]
MVYSFSKRGETTVPNQSLGGKGRVLVQLYQASYPVPDGFVITPDAFNSDGLRPKAWGRVEAELSRLRDGNGRLPLAVRSSALSEDSAQASYAGEFETVLNVVNDNEIRKAIHAVHNSRENERVLAYTQAQGINSAHEMAVVVQKMAPAAMSGVLFTADPVTGSHTHMTGNYVHGLGEKLVSGEATGREFRLRRPYGRYDGPKEMKRYGRKLFKLAQKLEKELGGPQDIEWAVADGKIHLLQSRPITAMQGYDPSSRDWNDSRCGDYLWSNANFGEALPDVMTPLTWSVFQIYFAENIPFAMPGDHPPSGNIGGRFYFNISLFASLVAALGFNSRKVLTQNSEIHGGLPDDVEIPIIPFSPWTTISVILPFIVRAKRRNERDKKMLPQFMGTINQRTAAIRQKIYQSPSPEDLINLWRDDLLPLFRETSRALRVSVGQMEDPTSVMRRKLVKLVGQDDAGTLLTGVNKGRGELDSLGPLMGLSQVAAGKMSREAYIRQFGHRGPHEAELSTPRPAEDAAWIDAQLVQFAPEDATRIQAMLAAQQARHDAAWRRLQARHPRRAPKLRRQLDAIAQAARVREIVRSEVTRVLWALRDFVLQAGKLIGLGDDAFFLALDELIEVLDGNGETAVSAIPARKKTYEKYRALPPYPTLIRGRFDPERWAQDPDRRGDVFDAAAPDLPGFEQHSVANLAGLTTISGNPGAPGIVEGIVRCLDSLDEANQLQPGEILVTTMTNIGWTPLFPKVTAVVTDVGAPLSHAAIVARELGVPAVVGCGNATMRLQTGDRVQVNGGRGIVQILERS